jgi:hypothetical protein
MIGHVDIDMSMISMSVPLSWLSGAGKLTTCRVVKLSK